MTEPKGDPSPDKDSLSQKEKDMIDMDFAGHAIGEDIGNSLSSLLMRNFLGGLESIAPIQTYEEYTKEMASKYQNPEAYYDYVISKSDPVIVDEWNSKICAFNDDLERIKREKDDQMVQAFYEEMIAFLR